MLTDEICRFNSCREIDAEAAISRLNGGIHYKPAVDYGVERGNKVGQFIIENVITTIE